MSKYLHIGIDDTDSPRKGCTTYVAALLVERLSEFNVDFIDFPSLIRLNPNVPWKTRGNGSLCLRIRYDNDIFDEIQDLALQLITQESDISYDGTDPAVVFFHGTSIPQELTLFSNEVIQKIVELDRAISLIQKYRMEAVGFKEGRGIIGALAAIGETLLEDHTYEFITYRKAENIGSLRKIDNDSVFKMDSMMNDLTFNNIDYDKRRVLIAPRGLDPVLFGVRGETPDAVAKAASLVEIRECIDRWVIFRTNQGTDAHFFKTQKISNVRPYHPVIIKGRIHRSPFTIKGRHVIFSIEDESGAIDCAAYEPTGNFRNIIRKLMQGDIVEVYGGVRPANTTHSMTINLEKLRVLHLVPSVKLYNPVCPQCNKRMKSMGSNSGFRCDRCGFRDRNAMKEAVLDEREINTQLYIPPARANRHLTKPLVRYERENSFKKLLKPTNFWGFSFSDIKLE